MKIAPFSALFIQPITLRFVVIINYLLLLASQLAILAEGGQTP